MSHLLIAKLSRLSNRGRTIQGHVDLFLARRPIRRMDHNYLFGLRYAKGPSEKFLPLTRKKLQEAAKAINPEIFGDYPWAVEIARYIKRAIKTGRLELLTKRIAEERIGSIHNMKKFAQMCVENDSWYLAIASLIKDSEVMEVILYVCKYNQGDSKEILARCGTFKGVSAIPSQSKGTDVRFNDKQNKKFKDWADKTFGEDARRVKEGSLDTGVLKKLSWRYAIVYYLEMPYNGLARFCNSFGQSYSEDGWYRALQKVFELSDSQIEKIKFAHLKD